MLMVLCAAQRTIKQKMKHRRTGPVYQQTASKIYHNMIFRALDQPL